MKILALSEANILSIHSMAMIAAAGEEGLSAQKIAQSTNSSRHHLFKVLEILAKSGLIYSTRGPAGGYHLNKPADTIYLLDIYESLNGKIDENNLCFGKANSELSFVIFENLCKELSYKFLNYLKSTKLSDIKDKAKIF
jgi:Rrf2 family protein